MIKSIWLQFGTSNSTLGATFISRDNKSIEKKVSVLVEKIRMWGLMFCLV
ncbi:unnamed protein product [Paramecium octaurelia]|uniref:Uncharacterized protein n=1 Tax=Paramecium octaurelia TaxID=43137 RepID=A0A8S1SJI9_PAROT|nr:unnamed protein product [Paramecium octaurelia]